MAEIELRCAVCRKKPEEIPEYVEFGRCQDMTADEFCWEEEGTLNKALGLFCCTDCYIQIGMPSNSDQNWTPQGFIDLEEKTGVSH